MTDQIQFEVLDKENQLLVDHNQQIVELGLDFNAMLLNREESKKTLEAKFEDLQKQFLNSRKLVLTKEYLNSDKQRINDTLEAFNAKYSTQIEKMNAYYHNRIQKKEEIAQNSYNNMLKKLDQLKVDIDQERKDRNEFNIQNLKHVREELLKLENDFKLEKQDRSASFKMILRNLDDNNFELNTKLINQQTEKNIAINEYKVRAEKAIANLSKCNEKFNTKVTEEFKHIINNIHLETTNRSQRQDKIIDNLSNLLTTLHDTLNIFAR